MEVSIYLLYLNPCYGELLKKCVIFAFLDNEPNLFNDYVTVIWYNAVFISENCKKMEFSRFFGVFLFNWR